jgi:lysozyme
LLIYTALARRKKKRSLQLLFISVILLAGIAATVYYLTNRRHTKFVRYPAFGIDMPVNYTMHGIDVSRHQDVVNWNEVKAMQVKKIKIGFAFIKATEGLGRVDDEFRYNWSGAKKAGMPRGAYHYFIASKSGKAQAENFIETVKLQKGDLPPVLDVEETNGANLTDLQQRVQDWLTMVEKHYNTKPIIYTSVNFYENFLADKFDDYPLWIAHYLVQDKPRIKRSWTFWQHSEKGHVNGISTYVDFNAFNGDSTDFRKLLVK